MVSRVEDGTLVGQAGLSAKVKVRATAVPAVRTTAVPAVMATATATGRATALAEVLR